MDLGPANPVQARIGRAIRQRRQNLGLSLTATAAQLGVAISTLSKLENGLVPITFQRLDAISRLLKWIWRRCSQRRHRTRRREQRRTSMRNLAFAGALRAHRTPFLWKAACTRFNFHGTDLLEKHVQPLVAEIHISDINQYGAYTRHPGEEFNFVLSGELEFHTDVYAPVRLKVGDSVYFDAEMGHAHTKVGNAKCTILAVLIPRSSEMVKNNTAPILEVTRNPPAAREPLAVARGATVRELDFLIGKVFNERNRQLRENSTCRIPGRRRAARQSQPAISRISRSGRRGVCRSHLALSTRRR